MRNKALIHKAVDKTIITDCNATTMPLKTIPKHDRSDGSPATKSHAREGAANEDIQRWHSPWQCAPPSMDTENARILLVNPIQSSRSTFSRGSLLSFLPSKQAC